MDNGNDRGGQIEMGKAPNRVVLDVPFRVIAKILASVLAFSIAVSLLDSVRTVLIWLGMAVFIAIALNPAVVRVERLMRRTWAVVTVFFTFVVGLLLVLALLAAPFVSQINELPKSAPQAAERLTRNPLIHRLDQHYDIVAKAEAHAALCLTSSSAPPGPSSTAWPRQSPCCFCPRSSCSSCRGSAG